MPRAIELTLYDPETNAAIKTYTRSFVPWGILKHAIRLEKSIDMDNLSEEDMDSLASLVVAVFGDQFTVQDVTKGADLGEMATVMMDVISRASQFVQGKKPQATADPTTAAQK